MTDQNLDVIIVGGGPAGLSAALVLGRCQRSVLLIDAGKPRNAASNHAHGFLSRDGDDPHALIEDARKNLTKYTNVKTERGTVAGVSKRNQAFAVRLADDREYNARKLVLATGVVDILPQFEGLDRFYGTYIHPCPYCDAWEHRDTPIAVYGNSDRAVALALLMKQWSTEVTLCTDGPCELSLQELEKLRLRGVAMRKDEIRAAEGTADNILKSIVFRNGPPLDCAAMFTALGVRPRLELFQQLGCEIGDNGCPLTSEETGETSVRGVYAAGDSTRDLWLIVVAAAEGAKAAVAINKTMCSEKT